jgi:hypothetical protein
VAVESLLVSKNRKTDKLVLVSIQDIEMGV